MNISGHAVGDVPCGLRPSRVDDRAIDARARRGRGPKPQAVERDRSRRESGARANVRPLAILARPIEDRGRAGVRAVDTRPSSYTSAGGRPCARGLVERDAEYHALSRVHRQRCDARARASGVEVAQIQAGRRGVNLDPVSIRPVANAKVMRQRAGGDSEGELGEDAGGERGRRRRRRRVVDSVDAGGRDCQTRRADALSRRARGRRRPYRSHGGRQVERQIRDIPSRLLPPLAGLRIWHPDGRPPAKIAGAQAREVCRHGRRRMREDDTPALGTGGQLAERR